MHRRHSQHPLTHSNRWRCLPCTCGSGIYQVCQGMRQVFGGAIRTRWAVTGFVMPQCVLTRVCPRGSSPLPPGNGAKDMCRVSPPSPDATHINYLCFVTPTNYLMIPRASLTITIIAEYHWPFSIHLCSLAFTICCPWLSRHSPSLVTIALVTHSSFNCHCKKKWKK